MDYIYDGVFNGNVNFLKLFEILMIFNYVKRDIFNIKSVMINRFNRSKFDVIFNIFMLLCIVLIFLI